MFATRLSRERKIAIFTVKAYPLNAWVLMNLKNNIKTTSVVIMMSTHSVQSCAFMFYIYFSLILTKPYEVHMIIFLMRKLRLRAAGIWL